MKSTNRTQARKPTAKAILSNLHTLKERRYVGDLDASDTLIDLQTAISNAKLTERQLEALHLVYGKDLTQAKVGERMGVKQDAISKLTERAERKIDVTYEKWDKKDLEAGLL